MKTTQKQQDMKMKIVFDEEKIKREGKYDVDALYAKIDAYFERLEIPKIGKGVYKASGKRTDYSRFMGAVWGLGDAEWFMDNASEWFWEDGGSIEDVKSETIRCAQIYGH